MLTPHRSFRLFLAACAAALPLFSQGIITTLAGGGGAQVTPFPVVSGSQIAADSTGNLYIAEPGRIRRLTPGGAISTLFSAGAVVTNTADGQAVSLAIDAPKGLAVDAAGNLFWSDSTLKRLTPDGKLTLWQPAGVTAAPAGLSADLAGNIYATYPTAHRVYQFSTAGVATLLAGTGAPGFSGDGAAATAATLNGPNAVAVDFNNQVFIADSGNYRVRRVSGGNITTVAGTGAPGFSGEGGPGTSAALGSAAYTVATDLTGNLFIADPANQRIRKLASGNLTTWAGTGTAGYSGDGGAATSALIRNPGAVAADAAGNLFFADQTPLIRRVTSGGTISTVAGWGTNPFGGDGGDATLATLYLPSSLQFAINGDIYLADTGNNRVRKFTPGGTITTVAGNGTGSPAAGNGGPPGGAAVAPRAVAVSTITNTLYIADPVNHQVRKVDSSGQITLFAGTGTAGFSGDGALATSALLNTPSGIAVDSSENVYIADSGNGRIRRVTPDGMISTIAGCGYGSDCGVNPNNGQAALSRLDWPLGLAVTNEGMLYISENTGHRIRRLSNSTLSTYAGTGLAGFSGDGGAAASARLNGPAGLALDPWGYLYVADSNNHRVRKIHPDGTIVTIAGSGVDGFNGDNQNATIAQLSRPLAVLADGGSNVYIADTGNQRIRKVSAAPIVSIAIQTVPSGLTVQVGGTNYQTPAVVNLDQGSLIEINAVPQVGNGSTRLGFAGWSDGGAQSHVISVGSSSATYTATYITQYLITTTSTPLPGGTVVLSPASVDGYYTAGTILTATANPFSGYGFTSFSGGISTTNNPATAVVNASYNINANFGCGFVLTPSSATVTAVAGNGSFAIGGAPNCAPFVSSNQPWVTLNSTGTVVYYSYLANTGPARSAIIQVGSTQFLLQQAGTNEVTAAWRDIYNGYKLTIRGLASPIEANGVFASEPALVRNSTGDTFLIGRDSGGAIWARVLNSENLNFEAPWARGGGVFQGDPAVAMVSEDTVVIIARDQGQAYWTATFHRNNGFSGWTNLTGVFTTDPAIAACPDGHVFLAGRDLWNGIWTMRFQPGFPVTTWNFGGGITPGKPSITCGADNAAYVGVRDPWNSAWIARVVGASYPEWQPAGGTATIDPQVVSLNGQRTGIVVRDNYNGLWYRVLAEGGGTIWSEWVYTGGVATDFAAAAPGGILTVGARDLNHRVWWWQSTNGWGPTELWPEQPLSIAPH